METVAASRWTYGRPVLAKLSLMKHLEYAYQSMARKNLPNFGRSKDSQRLLVAGVVCFTRNLYERRWF